MMKKKMIIIEPGQECGVCKKPFSNESTIAMTQDQMLVHSECLSEEEKKTATEFLDLFSSVC